MICGAAELGIRGESAPTISQELFRIFRVFRGPNTSVSSTGFLTPGASDFRGAFELHQRFRRAAERVEYLRELLSNRGVSRI